MRSEGYGTWSVCVSVCPLDISLLQHSFVPHVRTSRWMKIRNFVRFSLNILRCRARALADNSTVDVGSHFLLPLRMRMKWFARHSQSLLS